MKKIVSMVAMLTMATVLFGQVEGSVTTNPDTVESVVKKNFELTTNVFGLFLGSYTVGFELGLSEGLIGLGPKFTYVSQKFGAITYSGIDLYGVARLYPSLYRRGFYVMVEIGYTSWEVKDSTYTTKLESIPMMAGLGFKWVINQFSIDLGAAYGKRIYLNNPTSGSINIDEFPFNLAYDAYLLFGFRF